MKNSPLKFLSSSLHQILPWTKYLATHGNNFIPTKIKYLHDHQNYPKNTRLSEYGRRRRRDSRLVCKIRILEHLFIGLNFAWLPRQLFQIPMVAAATCHLVAGVRFLSGKLDAVGEIRSCRVNFHLFSGCRVNFCHSCRGNCFYFSSCRVS